MGPSVFCCCWETWCQWFGFPLTECLWVFDNDDDCEDQWSWSCRHGWWLCAELIPGDKLLIGILSRIFSSWVKSILPHWFCYATSTRQVRPTYMSCLMTILTLQGVFPLLSLFNSISTSEIQSITWLMKQHKLNWELRTMDIQNEHKHHSCVRCDLYFGQTLGK